MRLKVITVFVVGITGLACTDAVIYSQESGRLEYTEYEIKAAYLYNFTKFIEWPQTAFSDDSTILRIGILGQDLFRNFIEEIIRDKSVRNRKLVVERFRNVAQVKNCQMVYISPSEKSNLRQILARFEGSGILTIGESRDFIRLGGIIRLLNIGNKVRFEINPAAAKRAGLQISSRLLKLAENLRSVY